MTDIVFETFDSTENRTFTKTNFLIFDYGTHTVRLLTAPRRVFTHFFKGKGTIKCLGRDCPVCKVNKSLQSEYPEDYKSQPAYNSSTPRHYINVYDRTMVKVCPECKAENKKDIMSQYPNVCTKCGTVITGVVPARSNTVKVANISDTNAERLMGFRLSVRDDNDEPLGLRNFDVDFTVARSGGRKDISVSASSSKGARDEVEVPEELFYDLDKQVVSLEQNEIVNFMRGVSLKDIFTARKGTKEASTEADKAVYNSVEEKLKELGF